MTTTELPTDLFDVARFTSWLRQHDGWERAHVRTAALADGGVSNLTVRLALGDAPTPTICLRIERPGGIFAPYDVVHEAQVVRALAATDVPVPAVIGWEPDARILGAPFAVLDWIDAPHMGVAGPEADYEAFVAMVVRIHGVEPSRVAPPLAMPATVHAALARELDDIEARYRAASATNDALTRPVAALRGCIPTDGRLALCQGDVNVFNYLFRQRVVVGVVDWERAAISDPRSDIGQMLALTHLKGQPWLPADETPFALAYGAVSGRPLTGLAWFRARWLADLAVISLSAAAHGMPPLWFTWDDVTMLLERAVAELVP